MFGVVEWRKQCKTFCRPFTSIKTMESKMKCVHICVRMWRTCDRCELFVHFYCYILLTLLECCFIIDIIMPTSEFFGLFCPPFNRLFRNTYLRTHVLSALTITIWRMQQSYICIRCFICIQFCHNNNQQFAKLFEMIAIYLRI